MELARKRLSVVLSSVASDSHTWNLVYLQLLLEEMGHEVVNLGACVPDDLLVAECVDHTPDLVVLSSVNGHGSQDGDRVVRRLRACPELTGTPVVIGGKLGVDGDGRHTENLLRAGFDAVFGDGTDEFKSFVDRLLTRVPA